MDPRVYAQGDPSTRVYFNMFVNEMLNVRERLHAGTSRPKLPVGIPVDLEAIHWNEGAASKYAQLQLFVVGKYPSSYYPSSWKCLGLSLLPLIEPCILAI
jgi:hypothetical protein